MTKDEMLERAKAFMVRVYGAPSEMDAAGSDWWYTRLGFLVEFISEIAPTVEPTARLTEMNFTAKEGEPFEASAKFQGDTVKEWSLAMVQWFREKGGINYVTCDLSDPTTGERYEITMQKAGGRTPAQDLNELRSQLNRQAKPTAPHECPAVGMDINARGVCAICDSMTAASENRTPDSK